MRASTCAELPAATTMLGSRPFKRRLVRPIRWSERRQCSRVHRGKRERMVTDKGVNEQAALLMLGCSMIPLAALDGTSKTIGQRTFHRMWQQCRLRCRGPHGLRKKELHFHSKPF